MSSLNSVSFTGRAGRDPEVRYFDDGRNVANVVIAVDQRKRKGEDQPPIWVDCAFWGKTAQVVADYVQKGTMIGVVGELLPPDAFQDKQGNLRAKVKVAASNLTLLGRAAQAEEQPQVQQRPAAQPQAQAQSWDSQELPF